MSLTLDPESKKRVVEFLSSSAPAPQETVSHNQTVQSQPTEPLGMIGPLTESEKELFDFIRKLAA